MPDPSSTSSPARTLSDRVAPPATSVTRPPSSPMAWSMSSGWTVTTIRSKPAKAAMLRASTLRSPNASHCLGTSLPIRVPRPAAVISTAIR